MTQRQTQTQAGVQLQPMQARIFSYGVWRFALVCDRQGNVGVLKRDGTVARRVTWRDGGNIFQHFVEAQARERGYTVLSGDVHPISERFIQHDSRP